MIDDSKLVASLLEEGLADQRSIDAIRATTKGGHSLYEALIRANLVEETKVVGVASRVLNIPMGHVPNAIAPEILRLVPASLAHRNRAIPLAKSDSTTLVLGMVNPTDELGRDEVAMHAGMDVEVVLIGPGALDVALSEYYPQASASSDAVDAFDNFELSSYGEELPGDGWSDYFDDSEASVEDSAVLSRDMRDRPSTDVLAEELGDEAERIAAEEDLPEIEIIEELGQPIRKKPISPYASLETWEVDAAIGGSAIVSAADAGSLFETSDDAQEEDAGATNQLAPAAAVDARRDEGKDRSARRDEGKDKKSASDTDTLTDKASKTSVGVGVEELHRGAAGTAKQGQKKRPSNDAKTGKTEVGLPVRTEAPNAVLRREVSEATEDEPPDYAALGLAILQAKLTQDTGAKEAGAKEAAAKEAVADTSVTQMKPVTKKQGAVVALFEDDDEEIPQINAKTTHARGQATLTEESEAAIALPEEIDPNALAAALAALLVGKGILTLDEIVSLARQLTVDQRRES